MQKQYTPPTDQEIVGEMIRVLKDADKLIANVAPPKICRNFTAALKLNTARMNVGDAIRILEFYQISLQNDHPIEFGG